MHSIKTRFSLVLCALCLCGTNAMAAPSVRILGTNNAGIKPVAAKTGNTNQNTSAAKKASVKASGITTGQKSLSNSSNAVRIGKVNTASGTNMVGSGANRLPIITAKPKVAGSVNADGTANAKLNEFGERLDAFELGLDGKANLTDLDNYYTKQEIDEFKEDYYTKQEINDGYYTAEEIDEGYYTAEEIDEKISGLNNLVLENGESVAGMSGRISQNESGIAAINTAMDSVGVQITALSEGVDTNNTNIASIQDQLEEINNRIEDINTISSVTEVRRLKERIHGYQVQLEEVLESSQMIYDAETGTYRMVRVINDFEPSVLTQASNLND